MSRATCHQYFTDGGISHVGTNPLLQGVALKRYIRTYQLHRMLSISHAPPSLQLHYRTLRKHGLRYRIAKHGYFDPAAHQRQRLTPAAGNWCLTLGQNGFSIEGNSDGRP